MIHEDFALHADSSHEITDDAMMSKLILLLVLKDLNQSTEILLMFLPQES